MADAISQNLVISTTKNCGVPEFRFPDVPIPGLDPFIDPLLDIIDDYAVDDGEVDFRPGQVGTPTELSAQVIQDQKITKKGTSTFVDVIVTFDPAPGAEYHEFRVMKDTQRPIITEDGAAYDTPSEGVYARIEESDGGLERMLRPIEELELEE